MIETVFRTEDVPVADRFDRWREHMAKTHVPMELVTHDPDEFQAEQRHLGLGAVSVIPASFVQPLVFRRTPELVRRSDPQTYRLMLLLSGTGIVAANRRTVPYRPYDVLVLDSSRPFELSTGPHSINSVGIELPKALLSLPSGKAERVVGRTLSGREGTGLLLRNTVTHLISNADQHAPSEGPRLGTVVADLASALFAHVLDADDLLPPETHQQTLALRVRAFIQQHLHDPELTPRAIAAVHHISLSHLHRLFRDQGLTVSTWIRAERLERCRRDLADPALLGVPIRVIALRWGFVHVEHFTRAFRRAYGMTPGECRGDLKGQRAARGLR
ncbi:MULTISPECIES: helix-turn-helix domain-containing protein [unclassified Streptomyces]|uniref:AraC-like ligand-binding domain-containing protein n=1 Tax=unclassified Streptomyces TaxID=2593676 RepID=UPI00336A0167